MRHPILQILRAAAAASLALAGPAAAQTAAETGRETAPDSTAAPGLAVDTADPRATLGAFRAAVDAGLTLELEATRSYLASDRLYPNVTEMALRDRADLAFAQALETLDLSRLPAGFHDALATERLILLAEVLARIDLPAAAAVPDAAAMRARGATRWPIPGTRIDIALVAEGPRRGEYLFSARAVARLPADHARMRMLPYRPGAVQAFVAAVTPYTAAGTLYDIYRGTSTGLGIVPGRWMLAMPGPLRQELAGIALWQWLALGLYVAFGALALRLLKTACWRLGARPELCVALAVLGFAGLGGLAVPLLGQLHFSGGALVWLGTAATAFLYVGLAAGLFTGAGAIAEAVIAAQRLRAGGIDSQITRLWARLAALVLAALVLIEGADRLGLPAYSVLTGLGIGGLAVALAARETLANLFGSVVIMAEKPFRSGHWIRLAGAEGTVERIGFRSTRIRTFGDSLVSIPNSVVVNSVVDNLGVRGRRRQCVTLRLAYSTPLARLESFLEGARRVVAEHPAVDREEAHVSLDNLGADGLEVLVSVHLRVADYAAELEAREALLLALLRLAETLGIAHAYPTRTVQLAQAPDATAPTPETPPAPNA